MQWDWQNRCLHLSVGELSRFSLVSPAEERAGRWRMELGTHWHEVLRERAETESAAWRFEFPVSGSLYQNGWQFTVQGRIDQLNPDAHPPLLREVKTVSMDLPAHENELRERYPHYFHQAMLYGFLLGRTGTFPQTELVFLEIQTGLSQPVRLGEADLEALHRHLARIVDSLEERREHFRALRRCRVPEPFRDWRPGQLEARRDLDAALGKGPIVFMEAPTGFGKTALALEQGLLRLASGEIERILILTSKNTGHTPLLDQLEAFRRAMPGLTIHALRSRHDHLLDADMEEALSRAEVMERWEESGLSAPGLLADGILELETIRLLGERHGIPPWIISRMLLPFADVWIADYNYLFDPGVSPVLESLATYVPERTLLIIDEAHNLPERAAASRSHLLDAAEISQICSEVQLARFPGPCGRLLDVLLSIVRKQPPADSLDPPAEADLIGLLREIESAFKESSFGEDELGPASREWLWNLPSLLADWDAPGLPMLAFSPSRGRVLLACLDASAAIGPILRSFKHSLLMSATLQPWENLTRAVGLSAMRDPITTVVGTARWLEGCFEVVVDARVDTRFRQRDHFLPVTATTLGESALQGKGCTVAFFPSYAYAEKVLERVAFLYPALRMELQPRNLPLEEQTDFLERALLFDDLLFLVLGSRFSEGIDALGGKVAQAIVVGPALPEVNSLQKAREAMVAGNAREAFRTIYLIPGIRKISQAIGRLVRHPDQRARVLLHGKRFLEPAYQDLLPAYLQPVETLVTDEEFARIWLNS